jgi:hypothetical protein
MRKFTNINFEDLDDALNDCEAHERVESFCKYMEIDVQGYHYDDYKDLVKNGLDKGIEDFELVAMIYDFRIGELSTSLAYRN